MDQFNQAKVIVAGDIMLDRYWEGQTSRISPEAPVPVVHIKKTYEKAGGAGNVALNIATLQGKATVLAMTGKDEAANCLQALLKSQRVQCDFVVDQHLPTITKLRLLSQHQQLIRADFEENFKTADTSRLMINFKKHLKKANVAIVSDYGKGTIADIEQLIALAIAQQVPVLVDPKSHDFSHYRGATLITPNYKEFVAAAGPCEDDVEMVNKAQQMIKQFDLGGLLITRGAEGMTLIRPQEAPVTIPTQAREVYDVTGAGDTVIAVMAMSIGAGYDWVTSMKYANAAASVVVGKIGTATVSPEELHEALNASSHIRTGVVNEKTLLTLVQKAKQRGEKIVMTNGCFDLLHAGHVDYLQAAKALGDRLIIAVNDDASVTKLKGPSRPVNVLSNRMHVLEALDAVDWVVPFSEETPERLIGTVMPDILVKGADYQIDQIAGAKAVLANGGEVKTITQTPGCSTSKVIDKIQGAKL